MYNLTKFFYLFLILSLFFIIFENNLYTIINVEADNSQAIKAIKQETEISKVGQVPEILVKSQKMVKLKSDKRLNLVVSFKVNNEKELRDLISDIYNPKSTNYHKWLSPEEFGEKFGRSEKEINDVVNWFTAQGFTVEEVWTNHLSISFSAPSENIERAFQLEINEYKGLDGRIFYSNSKTPKLPRELRSITSDIYGLNNAYLYKTNSRLHPFSEEQKELLKESIKSGKKIDKNFRIGNSPIFFGPDDFALAYNIAPVSDSGIQGQGQRVAIIIDSNVLDDDVNLHRQLFGLPFTTVKRFVPPGLEMPPVRFLGEAELDIDSVSVIAPMAEINLVLIPELSVTNVFLAEQFIINTLKIPIVSESFGGCEANVFSTSEQMLMLQGVAQGIAFFIAAGDEGAECFPGGSPGQAAINCPACYEGATAVGGTEVIADYDLFGDLANIRQESVWNVPPGVRFDCDGNPLSTGGATGGGASQRVSRPNYQIQASDFIGGLPPGSKRLIPDISLLAGQPGTAIVVNNNGFIAFGTSQSAPLWAGIMALVNQAKKSPQGSPNSEIYRLGKEQFNNSGSNVFRDITFGNNNTSVRMPCAQAGTKGFLASKGYDLVTGWGVPNLEIFIKNFAPDKTSPVVKVTSPQAGDIFKTGDKIRIDWQSTDNFNVVRHNIDLSTDGGNTFPIVVAQGLQGNTQNTIFAIPDIPTLQARIRVTSIDDSDNSGFGISQGNFTIARPVQDSFELVVSPISQTKIAGESAIFDVRGRGIGNFSGNVELTTSVSPLDTSLKATSTSILVPVNALSSSSAITVSSLPTTGGDFKLTILGKGRGNNGDEIVKTVSIDLKILQPDFSLALDSPQVKITRGQKLSFSLRVDRVANFSGKVTVTAPDVNLLKLKLTPSSQNTVGNSLSFSLKAKKSGPVGLQELVFTGQDDLGRVRKVTLNLLIE
jgi:subtilase family serine protease